jgi:hypothetical protein
LPEIKTIALENGIEIIKNPLQEWRGLKPKPTAYEKIYT